MCLLVNETFRGAKLPSSLPHVPSLPLSPLVPLFSYILPHSLSLPLIPHTYMVLCISMATTANNVKHAQFLSRTHPPVCLSAIGQDLTDQLYYEGRELYRLVVMALSDGAARAALKSNSPELFKRLCEITDMSPD